jgi:hypothetical protein
MIFRLKVWALAAAALVGALLAAFFKGRAAGEADSEAETTKAREALREKYDEIDDAPVRVDDAYDRLRRMSEPRR